MTSFGFISYIWKGESASPPANPVQNWVYRDTSLKQVRLYDGGVWKTMVKDGQGIKAMSVTYVADAQGTTPPTNGWTTDIPTVPQGQFLWTKINFTLDDASQAPSYLVTRQAMDGVNGTNGINGTDGIDGRDGTNGRDGTDGTNGRDGIDGSDGIGIASSEVSYAEAASGVTPPTTGWQSTVPSIGQGSFLWTRTVFTLTNTDTETAYSVSYQGVDGGGGSGGTSDHTQLTNRDAADQHPIEAITGLGDALGEKANNDDLGTAAEKNVEDFASADQGGKASSALQPVENPNTTNFPMLDAQGKLINGSSNPADFATSEQGGKAETALQPVTPSQTNSIAILHSDGTLKDSGTLISDLATSAQGAKANSALQPTDLQDPATATASGKPADALSVKTLVKGVSDDVADIEALIPTQANTGNQLADKQFVNSTIQNFAANYVTPTLDGNSLFASLAAANAGPWFHAGESYTPSKNDYATYANDTEGTWRVGFDGTQFNKQYHVNEQPMTASQVAALNSNITAEIVAKSGNKGITDADLADTVMTVGSDTAAKIATQTGTKTALFGILANAINGLISKLTAGSKAITATMLSDNTVTDSQLANTVMTVGTETTAKLTTTTDTKTNLFSKLANAINGLITFITRSDGFATTDQGSKADAAQPKLYVGRFALGIIPQTGRYIKVGNVGTGTSGLSVITGAITSASEYTSHFLDVEFRFRCNPSTGAYLCEIFGGYSSTLLGVVDKATGDCFIGFAAIANSGFQAPILDLMTQTIPTAPSLVTDPTALLNIYAATFIPKTKTGLVSNSTYIKLGSIDKTIANGNVTFRVRINKEGHASALYEALAQCEWSYDITNGVLTDYVLYVNGANMAGVRKNGAAVPWSQLRLVLTSTGDLLLQNVGTANNIFSIELLYARNFTTAYAYSTVTLADPVFGDCYGVGSNNLDATEKPTGRLFNNQPTYWKTYTAPHGIEDANIVFDNAEGENKWVEYTKIPALNVVEMTLIDDKIQIELSSVAASGTPDIADFALSGDLASNSITAIDIALGVITLTLATPATFNTAGNVAYAKGVNQITTPAGGVLGNIASTYLWNETAPVSAPLKLTTTQGECHLMAENVYGGVDVYMYYKNFGAAVWATNITNSKNFNPGTISDGRVLAASVTGRTQCSIQSNTTPQTETGAKWMISRKEAQGLGSEQGVQYNWFNYPSNANMANGQKYRGIRNLGNIWTGTASNTSDGHYYFSNTAITSGNGGSCGRVNSIAVVHQ